MSLKPLGGVTKKQPPSALASFAKSLQQPIDDVSVRPQALVLGALKPLGSPLKELPSTKKPADVPTALASFAKNAVLGAKADDAEQRTLGVATAQMKRPLPLPSRKSKADQKEEEVNEHEQRPTSRTEVARKTSKRTGDHKQGGEQHESAKMEPKLDPQPHATAPLSEAKAQQEETQSDDDSDGDGDSMAEFVCMESDSDNDEHGDEGEAKRSRDREDVDDLYDHDDDGDDDETEEDSPTISSTIHTRMSERDRIFVPRVSKEPLFHAILAHDIGLLSHLLSHMTPIDALAVRDADERTLYHYAALCRSSQIQAVVFEFVGCFFALEIENQVAEIQQKQRRLDNWRCDGDDSATGSTWVAPSVKDLEKSIAATTSDAYLSAIQACDRHGRSFLHYGALDRRASSFLASKQLRKTVKRHPQALLVKDKSNRSALEYAVMADNTEATTLWFTRFGIAQWIEKEDIDRLAHCSRSKPMQSLLFRLLENADNARVTKVREKPSGSEQQQTTRSLGLSVQFLNKIQHGSHAECGSGLGKPVAQSSARLWSSLHKAVIFGNVEAVEALIDQDAANLNTCDVDGWTPLHVRVSLHASMQRIRRLTTSSGCGSSQHCAAQSSAAHITIAQILIKHRANVNARSLHGRTPLHIVAMQKPHDHRDSNDQVGEAAGVGAMAAALLCGTRAKLEICDDDHCTPFLCAVRAGNVSVARFLLEQACDTTVVDKSGGCALHIAATRGLEEMVRFLGRWDAERPAQLLWRHCKDLQGRLPRALAKSDAITLAMDNLWYAARLGDLEQVRLQLQAYQQHSKHKRERLQYLSVHDVTAVSHRTALHLAIEGYFSADELCPSPRTATVNKDVSIVKRAVATVAILLQAGAKLSARDPWGITPLMLAACANTPKLIKTLLKYTKQEELTQQDAEGNTALHYSYAFCRAQISTLLEDAMEETEIENTYGKLPLAVTGTNHKLFPKSYRPLSPTTAPTKVTH